MYTNFLIKLLNSKYKIGSFLSIILTIIPFFMVFKKYNFSKYLIVLCALIQTIVHLICFLHINDKTNKNFFWNECILLFSIIIIFITLTGSIYIMFNLNAMI